MLRTADRLRGLSTVRLERSAGSESIAASSRRLVEQIVAATARLTGRSYPLPHVRSHGLADQLTVVGVELADLADEKHVEGLAELSAALRELRRSTQPPSTSLR